LSARREKSSFRRKKESGFKKRISSLNGDKGPDMKSEGTMGGSECQKCMN